MTRRWDHGTAAVQELGLRPSEGLPRRGAGLRRSEEEEEEDEDVDLAQVLAYLLRRGQVRLVQGGGAANLQLIQALSDSEEEHDNAWDGRLETDTTHLWMPP